MPLYGGDIESDGLLNEITKVWCASFSELDTDRKIERSFTETEYEGIGDMFSNPENIIVMHNGHSFDKTAVEKILKIKVEAEIVDTLYMSWAMYPKQAMHGLDYWGKILGIDKPKIDDWDNLTLEEYVNRCEEDVKIQVALWRHMWKHLKLLYTTDEEIWKFVRYASFKANCSAKQEKSRWKLDAPQCRKYVIDYEVEIGVAKAALEDGMPDVPQYAKRERPKKPFKQDGTLSVSGAKWQGIVVDEFGTPKSGRAVDYNKPIRVLTGYVPPNAGAHGQMKKWLTSLGWIPETFDYKRDKETNEVRKIPQIKDKETGELCPSVDRLITKSPAIEHLKRLSVVKHRLGICNGFLNNLDDQSFVQARVQGLTNTLRMKHKVCVNIPSSRKFHGKEIRGLLIARNDNYELCGSDMASLEDRTKQHYMWPYDPNYVKDMQVKGFDPHLDMAVTAGMMRQEETEEYKYLKGEGVDTLSALDYGRFTALDLIRYGGKTTNYAATYGATGPTIARAAGVPEATGAKLYDAYWRRNWSINAIADNCIVKQSRGLKWLWNPVAQMWYYLKAEKDRFSTLNQGTGAYAFDRWIFHVLERRDQLTAQFHDEGVWELLKGNREGMTKILKDSIGDVNVELNLNRELDVDVAFADSYAGVH